MHFKILECLQTSKVFKRQVQTCEVLEFFEIWRGFIDLTGLTRSSLFNYLLPIRISILK